MHPARSGLAFDVEATLAAARARSWNPVHLLQAVAGGEQVEPAVTVDRARLRAAVDRLAASLDRERVEGSVRFGRAGVVKPVLPVTGLTLVRRDSVAALAEAYLRAPYLDDGTPVSLAATTTARRSAGPRSSGSPRRSPPRPPRPTSPWSSTARRSPSPRRPSRPH